MRHVHAGRVAQDVETADMSGVSGTPTFFVNGQRYTGTLQRRGAGLGGAGGPDPGGAGQPVAEPGRRAGTHPPPRLPVAAAAGVSRPQRTGRRASRRFAQA